MPPLAASRHGATTEPSASEPAAGTFTVQHAENFTLTYDGDHKVLTTGTGDTAETFVLVQRGTEPPSLDGDLAGATVIEVPIETMFSESSSHYGFIDVLDIEATVTGVGDASLIVTPTLAERAAAGEIESFAPSFIVDPELVVAADPDVYVTGGFADPGARGHPRRRDPRRAERRMAGDQPRRVGPSGSACSPP